MFFYCIRSFLFSVYFSGISFSCCYFYNAIGCFELLEYKKYIDNAKRIITRRMRKKKFQTFQRFTPLKWIIVYMANTFQHSTKLPFYMHFTNAPASEELCNHRNPITNIWMQTNWDWKHVLDILCKRFALPFLFAQIFIFVPFATVFSIFGKCCNFFFSFFLRWHCSFSVSLFRCIWPILNYFPNSRMKSWNKNENYSREKMS